MDRRIHNAIKLAAAVFLLNACGFAAKETTEPTSAQPVTKSTGFVVGQAQSSDCFQTVEHKSEIVATDGRDDIFISRNSSNQHLTSEQPVVNQEMPVVKTKESCL